MLLLFLSLLVLAVLSLLSTVFAPPRFAAFTQIALAVCIVPAAVLAFLERSALVVPPVALAAVIAMLGAHYRVRDFDRNLGIALELLPGAVAFAIVWHFPRAGLVAILGVVGSVAWRELRVLPGRALAGPELTILGGSLLALFAREEPGGDGVVWRALLGALLAGAIIAAIAAAVGVAHAAPPGRASVLAAAAVLGGASVATTGPIAVAVLALLAYLLTGLSVGYAGALAWRG